MTKKAVHKLYKLSCHVRLMRLQELYGLERKLEEAPEQPMPTGITYSAGNVHINDDGFTVVTLNSYQMGSDDVLGFMQTYGLEKTIFLHEKATKNILAQAKIERHEQGHFNERNEERNRRNTYTENEYAGNSPELITRGTL